MKEILLDLLVVAYGGVGAIGLIAYWPTIKDLFHKKASANISSYGLWTFTTGITWLYSLFILPNLLFQLVSFANFAACTVVLVLSLRLRKHH